MLGLALFVAVVFGVIGWSYYQRHCALVAPDAAGTLSTSLGQAEAAAEESAKLPVVTGVPPVESVGSGQLAVSSEQKAVGSEQKAVGSGQRAEESVTQTVVTGVSPVSVVAEADALLAADKKDLARERYLEALAAGPDDGLRTTIEEKLGKLSAEMIRLPWAMAEKQDYVVQTNDAIKIIARKFGTTVEMIVKGNELKRPDIIRPGQRLKVFTGKMAIGVSKSRHDLLLTANGRFFKRYRVATGRYEKTPVGSFVITERIPEPPWHRDDGKIIPFGDKENILGTRWLAIKASGSTPEIKGYGIHGTWDNTSIGKSESAGCIRLKNEDIEELFEMVPVGTPVVIEE